MQKYGAGTNVGHVRKNNEDTFVCDAGQSLWLVADGMGGLGLGEVASAISAYTVTQLIRKGHGIYQAIESAHQEIKEFSQAEGFDTNMGTTLVLLKSKGSLYNIFWVGDSRAYLFDQALRQITVDHSLVQLLVDQGKLTPDEATRDPRKNAVTRALGVNEFTSVKADSVSDRWREGQKILLCTDGLTDLVSDAVIEEVLQGRGTDQQKVNRLIEIALANGGKDNVTVVLVSAPDSAVNPESDTEYPDTGKSTNSSQTRTASSG